MKKPVIFARMPKPDVELLKKVSRDRGEDVSDFVRRAVYKELASLSFLSNAQKKALGIKPPSTQSRQKQWGDNIGEL